MGYSFCIQEVYSLGTITASIYVSIAPPTEVFLMVIRQLFPLSEVKIIYQTWKTN